MSALESKEKKLFEIQQTSISEEKEKLTLELNDLIEHNKKLLEELYYKKEKLNQLKANLINLQSEINPNNSLRRTEKILPYINQRRNNFGDYQTINNANPDYIKRGLQNLKMRRNIRNNSQTNYTDQEDDYWERDYLYKSKNAIEN